VENFDKTKELTLNKTAGDGSIAAHQDYQWCQYKTKAKQKKKLRNFATLNAMLV